MQMMPRAWLAATILGLWLSACGGGDQAPAMSSVQTVSAVPVVQDASLTMSRALAVTSVVETTSSALVGQAVTLQDAIAILKLIVGLDVNNAGQPLTPYQVYAADVDGNGKVELADAIGVLKVVVGLEAPAATWLFFNQAGGAPVVSDAINPGQPPELTAAVSSISTVANVGLVAVLRGDVVGSALSYAWTLTSKPANSAASLTGATSAVPKFTADVVGTYVAMLTVTDANSNKETTTVTMAANPAPGISVAANLSGEVLLKLDNNVAYPSVTWFCDTVQVGKGTGVGNGLNWNTTTTANGQHLILAVVTLAGGSTLSVRQSVNVSNSNLAVSASASGTTGTIAINVTASSNFPITTVSATLDGISLGLLTAPNACSKYCSGTNNLYQFTINSVSAGSGAHSVVVTATDNSGSSKITTLALTISNPPSLVLSSPVDGGFINGAGLLNISGNMSSDKAGAVTVTAFLGGLPIGLTQGGTTFSGSFSLAGLPAGPYTLTLSARDSGAVTTTLQTSIVVASSDALTYTPAFSMGAGGQLITVDNSNPALLLYVASDGSYRVRNNSLNSEVILQGAAAIPHRYNWTMDGGYVFMEGGWLGSTTAGYTDCPLDCIYQWTPAGVKTNISNASPNSPSSRVGGGYAYEQYPRAHGGYVIWIDWVGPNPGTYTLYNVAQASYSVINQPAGANYLGNTSVDFAVINNVVNFFYWANTGTSTYDIYQWNSATRSSTKLSGGTTRSIYPQTDGQRVAWSQAPTSGSGTSSLVAQSVNGGAQTLLSTCMNSFTLAGGVLAWIECTASTNAQGLATTTITGLKASNSAGTVTTITSNSSATLYGAGGGHVIYGLQSKLYDWNASTASSSLLVDSVPGMVMVSGNTVYFTLGSSQAVYQVTLH